MTTRQGPVVSIVTNIPTPYRNDTFAHLSRALRARGGELRVHFMAWSEPDRRWTFGPADFDYWFTLHPGVHPSVRGAVAHFNPGLAAAVRADRPDVVIVGGYSTPSHLLAALRAPASSAKLLWSETHAASERRQDAALRLVKRKIVGRFDGFVVPGRRAADFLRALAPEVGSRPFLTLPNLIDERVFRDDVAAAKPFAKDTRRALGVGDEEQLWLCPARLEPFKGVGPFIDALGARPSVRLVVVGDGSERTALEARAVRRSAPVTLLGHQTQAEMVRLYAAADLFLLPSLQDPSPLSPIEALAAGLPLLVSTRIGNLEEVLADGVNGFGFDPDAGYRDLLDRVAALPAASLRAMGVASSTRFAARFAVAPNVDGFAEALTSVATREGARR